MNVGALRAAGAQLLRQHGVESPELDASLLLAFLLKKDRTWLILNHNVNCDASIEEHYKSLLERRADGESVAYITGIKEFMGLTYTVSPAVLVPRPDTEILVEQALQWLSSRSFDSPPRVLDVCSGSGCIGITLAYYVPNIELSLSDISSEALSISQTNALKLLGPEGAQKVRYVQSDMLTAFLSATKSFDLIVSNPPYIPEDRIPGLAKEVQKEPYIALSGGEEGLDLIRRLIPEAAMLLNSGGALFIESDPDQILSIQELLKNNDFHAIESYPDLSGTLRCTKGMRPSP
ncbi:peptide chain release factor N(5)-glutamine methyltransferase [Gracilinema caldarium]|uniref:peptide chain release factor N(5)-glutamine methyltransferase n=1 Tax=Gracilinema caldarium TaxID=215591 RepID=UPI0026F17C0D|nr:peptide chain release factor N(5)-glutamine methyltransferase [Gracilinema caldarium]